MSRGEKERMLEQGPIGATLLRLGLPMIVSMLVGALYNVVDTYFVAGLGTVPTAADAVTTLLAVPLLLRIHSRLGSGSASEAWR
ncbi:MAG: hypothetical protein Q4A13_07600 [Fretibacterium sp.]|nr:hypothetical protein [Fretibacterium sp.]